VDQSTLAWSVVAKFTLSDTDGTWKRYDSWGTTGHTGIVMGVSQQGVTLLDQNYFWDNSIRWHTIPWSEAYQYSTIKMMP